MCFSVPSSCTLSEHAASCLAKRIDTRCYWFTASKSNIEGVRVSFFSVVPVYVAMANHCLF